MEWFKHDSSASSDAKVKKLLIRHGALGYAIYFHCLELICGDVNKTNITFELEHDSEIIADNLKIKGTSDKSGIQIVEEIMLYIVDLGLFVAYDERIFCYKLLKRIDTSMTSNLNFRKLIIEAKNNNHDPVMTPSCKKEEKEEKEEKEKKDIYGENDNVKLTNKQYQKCIDTHGEKTTLEGIEKLSNYKASKGKTYKSDYGALNTWVWKSLKEESDKPVESSGVFVNDYSPIKEAVRKDYKELYGE